LDTYPISTFSLEKFFHTDGNLLGQQYKHHLSDYNRWDQKEHSQDWLLFPENIGPCLSLDETSLSNGELYTILTNKSAKGRKGSIVAMVKGTSSATVNEVLERLPEEASNSVKEITLDMAGSMRSIAVRNFPNAVRVIDRFHVQKLTYDALQEMRITLRWDAINEDTEAREQAKTNDYEYIPDILENGDTKKQLLVRSRYLLFKSADKWTDSQKRRAAILFELYPEMKKAYSLTHSLRMIFSKNKVKAVAYTSLARWFNDVAESGFKSFDTISATVYEHYPEILNFFDNRSTNASAESFNAKIKAFRATQRGVRDISFFLFRLTKIYA
jgi:transposase